MTLLLNWIIMLYFVMVVKNNVYCLVGVMLSDRQYCSQAFSKWASVLQIWLANCFYSFVLLKDWKDQLPMQFHKSVVISGMYKNIVFVLQNKATQKTNGSRLAKFLHHLECSWKFCINLAYFVVCFKTNQV
jgi:hypothetical protein